MNADGFDNLEQGLERESQWLRELPHVDLPAETLARTRAAVQAEVARLATVSSRPRRVTRWWLHSAAGVAAAIGLGILMLPDGRPSARTVGSNMADDVALDAWAAALRESTAQLVVQMDGYDASLFADDSDEWLSFDDFADDQGA